MSENESKNLISQKEKVAKKKATKASNKKPSSQSETQAEVVTNTKETAKKSTGKKTNNTNQKSQNQSDVVTSIPQALDSENKTSSKKEGDISDSQMALEPTENKSNVEKETSKTKKTKSTKTKFSKKEKVSEELTKKIDEAKEIAFPDSEVTLLAQKVTDAYDEITKTNPKTIPSYSEISEKVLGPQPETNLANDPILNADKFDASGLIGEARAVKAQENENLRFATTNLKGQRVAIHKARSKTQLINEKRRKSRLKAMNVSTLWRPNSPRENYDPDMHSYPKDKKTVEKLANICSPFDVYGMQKKEEEKYLNAKLTGKFDSSAQFIEVRPEVAAFRTKYEAHQISLLESKKKELLANEKLDSDVTHEFFPKDSQDKETQSEVLIELKTNDSSAQANSPQNLEDGLEALGPQKIDLTQENLSITEFLKAKYKRFLSAQYFWIALSSLSLIGLIALLGLISFATQPKTHYAVVDKRFIQETVYLLRLQYARPGMPERADLKGLDLNAIENAIRKVAKNSNYVLLDKSAIYSTPSALVDATNEVFQELHISKEDVEAIKSGVREGWIALKSEIKRAQEIEKAKQSFFDPADISNILPEKEANRLNPTIESHESMGFWKQILGDKNE